MRSERRQRADRRGIVTLSDARDRAPLPAVLGLVETTIAGNENPLGSVDPRGFLLAAAGSAVLVAWFLVRALLGGSADPVLFCPAVAGLLVEVAAGWALRTRPMPETPLALPVAALTGLAWGLLTFVPAPGLQNELIAVACGLLLLSALSPNPALVAAGGLGLTAGIAAGTESIDAVLALTVLVAGASTALARRRRAEIEAGYAAARVDLLSRKARGLLADFEDSGKGWFWETDAAGQLTYISAPLAHQLGEDPAELIGRSLTELFADESATEEQSPRGERTVGFHLSAGFAFTDAVVRAAGVEPARWWSISGRPAKDRNGRFLGFRGNGTDLTEMRRSEAEVSRLARFDALTGLPNRSQMRQTLETALRTADGRAEKCALMLLDLDRFKSVNDTLGHPVGDALLRQVSERLLGVVGEQGRVGRLGGDEFKVVVPRIVDPLSLAQLADAIINQLSAPYTIDGVTVGIGASIGIAVAPENGDCPDQLVRNADLALYAAKADGKGVHRFYEGEMHASARDRRLLEVDLRNALGSSESGLRLEYQPVVRSTDEAIVGFEALARWRHPTRGEVSPGLFIPLAEEIGLIPQIGEWVIREACMEAARWPAPVRVAVNVSPIQFANPALPAIVMSALAESQLAPDRLELEITEGVFLNDSAASDLMFARLAAIGVRFALDDFGTGYSSLGYLKRAPFNKIKIDQSFVRGAAVPGNRNAAIIRAIVTLAESLGMETTAEGAETHDELALIRSLGCSHVQGYIFGRPMGPDEARARLATGGHMEPIGFAVARAPRIAVLRSALLFSEGRHQPIRIRNVSEGGCMAETGADVPTGCFVEIALADGERIKGEVKWSESGRFGVQFREGFALDRLNVSRPTRSAA